MAFDSRDGEVGDFRVGDEEFVVHVIDESTETCAEDYGRLGHIGHFRAQKVSRLIDFF